MTNIDDTPQTPVGATALAKVMMRVARFNTTFVASKTPHGTKRGHQTAFGSEHREYGGLNIVPYSYTGLSTVIIPTQNRQQRPPALKPTCCRHNANEKASLSKAGLDVGSCPSAKSQRVSETASSKKAVNFSDEVHQVLFSRNDVIGQETGVATAQLSGIPSVPWQLMQLKKGISQRQRCLEKARDGWMPACVLHLQHRDGSKGIPNTLKGHANDNDDEISSTISAFAKMTLETSAPASSEVRVRHLLVGDLYFQAVQEIDDAVRHRLSTLKLDSRSSTDNSLRSAIEDLQKRSKERLIELLKYLGIIYPYHGQGGRSEAVEDARRDGDWNEVAAKADALFISCASPWVVQTLRDIIAQFNRKLDRKIRSRTH